MKRADIVAAIASEHRFPFSTVARLQELGRLEAKLVAYDKLQERLTAAMARMRKMYSVWPDEGTCSAIVEVVMDIVVER